MNLYGCGSNGNFQLGLNHHEDLDEFQLVNLPEAFTKMNGNYVNNIKEVASGGNHTIILFNNGEVFMTSQNNSIKRKAGNNNWICLNNEEIIGKVEHICSCWDYTILTNNKNGLFYINENKLNHIEKFYISEGFTSYIIELKGCMNHFILKTVDGEFYGYGNNKKGKIIKNIEKGKQILMNKEKIMVEITEDIDIHFSDEEKKAINFCVGKDYSVYYTGNKILIKGKAETIIEQMKDYKINEEKLFSILHIIQDKNFHECLISVRKNYLKIQQIQSMWTSIHVLAERDSNKNELISFGNNSHSQLLYGVTNVKSYKVGSEHGLLIFQEQPDTVHSWGWGEHGNCGKKRQGGDRVSLQAIQTVNKNHGEKEIKLVHAGCATSFIKMK